MYLHSIESAAHIMYVIDPTNSKKRVGGFSASSKTDLSWAV